MAEATPNNSPTPQTALKVRMPNNTKVFLFGFLGLIVVVLAAVVGTAVYRVYAKAAHDRPTMFVAKTLRLPALKVNDKQVLYSDYVDDFKAIITFRNFNIANPTLSPESQSIAGFTDEQLSDQVLSRLAANVVIADAARKSDLTVTDDDVAKIKNDLLAQFQNEAALDAALVERYGWDFNTYVAKVIRPYLLQQKLAEKMQIDPAAYAATREKAQQVLNEIKGGADFAIKAKQYGSDATAPNGGDLGWFARGIMVPQFEEAVFALKKGELSAEPVATDFGFHIIRLDDRRTTKTTDATGKAVESEEVKASHILFSFPPFDFDEYLNNQLQQATVRLYVKVHNPFVAGALTATSTESAPQ